MRGRVWAGAVALGVLLTGAPLIANTAAGTLAFVPLPVKLPGQGTTPATPATDILVIDAGTGTLVRTVTVTTPARRVEEHATQAIAVIGEDVIFTDAGRTYRVNFTSGAVVWQLDKFEAVTLAGERLIGVHTTATLTDATQAIDPATTATMWTEDGGGIGLKIQPGGPNFVIAVGTGYFKIFQCAGRDGHRVWPVQHRLRPHLPIRPRGNRGVWDGKHPMDFGVRYHLGCLAVGVAGQAKQPDVDQTHGRVARPGLREDRQRPHRSGRANRSRQGAHRYGRTADRQRVSRHRRQRHRPAGVPHQTLTR